MTATRQEGKSRQFRFGFPLLIAALVAAAGLGVAPVGAVTTELVVANRHTGLAIDGYDPVAYFTDARPAVGRAEWEFHYAGVTWRFRNEGNRAAFMADPEVYLPSFGGHDPVAVARGAATPGHPHFWMIAANRLHLFFNGEARAAFAENPARTLAAAERRWPEVLRTLAR
jgi:YHS domain-containing protein